MYQSKQVGVTTANSQLDQGRGPEKQVLQVAPLDLVVVQYTDDQGRVHQNVAYHFMGEYYFDMNGEKWLQGLRRCSDYVTQGISSKLVRVVDVPHKDAVDIVAGEIAKGGE